jgi:hypothetical protein
MTLGMKWSRSGARVRLLVVALLAMGLSPRILSVETTVAAPPVDATADEQAQIRDIVNRWLDALGGDWRIEQLRFADYHSVISFGPGLPAIDTYVRATADGAYRYDYELPKFGRLTQAFDGQNAWQQNAELGFGLLSPAEHAQNLGGVDFRAPIKVGAYFPVRKLLPDATINGRRLRVIELTDRQGGQTKWFFDPTTGLRVHIEANIGPDVATVDFSDFRRVQGIQEPFHTVRHFGQRVVDVKMLSVLYNEPADPVLFALPAAWIDDTNEVQRVLNNYLRWSGAANLDRVQTRFTKGVLENAATGLKTTTVTYQKRPNLFLNKQEAPGIGQTMQGFDGKTGWAWSELEGYRTMAGAELQQLVGGADLAGPLRLQAVCPLRKLLEETQDGDRRLVGIALATLQGPAGNFYFDTKTFYLVRAETFVQAGPSGQLKVVADFSDFRDVDGIMLPFVTTLTNPAMRIVERVESVQQNVPLDDAVFVPRKE